MPIICHHYRNVTYLTQRTAVNKPRKLTDNGCYQGTQVPLGNEISFTSPGCALHVQLPAG